MSVSEHTGHTFHQKFRCYRVSTHRKNKKQQKIYTHQQFASSTAMIIHKQAKSRKSRKTRTHINSFPNTISNKNNVHHHRSTTCKDHTNKLNRAMATKRNKVEINTKKKITHGINKLQLHFNNDDHTNKLS